MSKTPFIVFGIVAVVCVLVLPALALNAEGDEQSATVQVAAQDQAAKELIATSCGPCHTLAAAGIDGVVGPNLDELLVPSGENSPELYKTIYTQTIAAIVCGKDGRMPPGILLDEEAQQAAVFVAAYAGQIGKGPTVDSASAETERAPDCP